MPRADRIVGQFTADLKTGSARIKVTDDMQITALHLRSYAANTLVGTWPNTLCFKVQRNNSDGAYLGKELLISPTDNSGIIFEIGLNSNSQGRWFGVNNGPLVEFDEAVKTTHLYITAWYRNGTDYDVSAATATSLWARFEVVYRNE